MAKTLALLAVIALVPIVHDHTRYEPGDELEIKATEAPQLLEVNAIKLKEDAADAPASIEAGVDALAAAQAQATADAKAVAEAKAATKPAAPAAAKKK